MLWVQRHGEDGKVRDLQQGAQKKKGAGKGGADGDAKAGRANKDAKAKVKVYVKVGGACAECEVPKSCLVSIYDATKAK